MNNYFEEQRETLKHKLWTYIDSLSDSDGFVLVVSKDELTFTILKSAGWDEHVLELEPLKEAEVRRDVQRLYEIRKGLITEQTSLATKVSVKKKELANIQLAITKAIK